METIRKPSSFASKQNRISRSDSLYQKACQKALAYLGSSENKFEKTDVFPTVEYFLQQIEARIFVREIQTSLNND